MRKLTALLSALLLLAACKKDTPEIYTASYLRSINGAPTYPVDFSGPIDQMSCDQSYYTGGGTRVSRWTFSFHSTLNNGSFLLTIPGTDTSNTLPIGKPLYFATGANQTTQQDFEFSVLDAGNVFSGSDSAVISITFSLFDKKATANFTADLYGTAGTYIITDGSFTDIPINYAQ